MSDRPPLEVNSKVLGNLAKANAIRLERAQDKRRIGDGELSAAMVLRTVPVQWEKAEVVDLLIAMPHVGRVKAKKWCQMATVNPHRTIGEMTHRERATLARTIDTWVGSRAPRSDDGQFVVAPADNFVAFAGA